MKRSVVSLPYRGSKNILTVTLWQSDQRPACRLVAPEKVNAQQQKDFDLIHVRISRVVLLFLNFALACNSFSICMHEILSWVIQMLQCTDFNVQKYAVQEDREENIQRSNFQSLHIVHRKGLGQEKMHHRILFTIATREGY